MPSTLAPPSRWYYLWNHSFPGLEPDHKAVVGSTVESVVGLLLVVLAGKDPSVLWVDGMADRILFSKVVLGQGSASVFTVGSSDNEPVTSCIDGRGSCKVPGCAFPGSLGESLGRENFFADYGWKGRGLVIGPLKIGSPGTPPLDVCRLLLEGAEGGYRALLGSLVAQIGLSPAGPRVTLWPAAGMSQSLVTELFHHLQLDQVWLACLQGLPGWILVIGHLNFHGQDQVCGPFT